MSVTINGSAGVTTNSGAVYNGIASGTAVSASGTSVDFTSIPSWVKRITVMFDGVSTSGTSPVQVQLGDSGGIETTGYVSTVASINGTSAGSGSSTAGYLLENTGVAAAANIRSGVMSIVNISGNTWVSNNIVSETTAIVAWGGGTKNLSATLDRIRITTANGTDTFDAGSINILYE